MIGRQFPILVISSVILGEQRCNLVAHDIVKFRRRHILVACHTFLDALDNLQGCVNTDIRCDKSLLKIIEHFVVDSRLTHDSTRNLVEDAVFCLLQTIVKNFFLVLIKKSKNSHITLFVCKDSANRTQYKICSHIFIVEMQPILFIDSANRRPMLAYFYYFSSTTMPSRVSSDAGNTARASSRSTCSLSYLEL